MESQHLITPNEYRETRKQLGLTQAEIAKKLGVSRMTIIRRESGKSISTEARLAIQAMCKSLNCE